MTTLNYTFTPLRKDAPLCRRLFRFYHFQSLFKGIVNPIVEYCIIILITMSMVNFINFGGLKSAIKKYLHILLREM